MKGYLYINDDRLGEVNFKVIDESMGVIGGGLKMYPIYEKYQKQIQFLYDSKGIANIVDLNFVIVLEGNTVLNSEGGIGVTDSVDSEEIYVESAGNDCDIIAMVKSKT